MMPNNVYFVFVNLFTIIYTCVVQYGGRLNKNNYKKHTYNTITELRLATNACWLERIPGNKIQLHFRAFLSIKNIKTQLFYIVPRSQVPSAGVFNNLSRNIPFKHQKT